MNTLRRLILGAAVAGSLALSGCGGSSFSCTYKGSCPNDTAPTASETAACNAAIGGACGSQYSAFGNCAVSNSSCDANGVSTINSTACSAQLGTLATCCQANPTTNGCH